MPRTDTIIVGARQAGLTLSRYLARAGHSHAILDRGRIGERWRSERWESLTLLTPNWLNRLHGGHAHPEADGYVRRDEFVDYLRRYTRTNRAPVHEHTAVTRVEPFHGGFRVDTEAGRWHARNVIIATGDSAIPRVPTAAASVPTFLHQIHANRYRNRAVLPRGGMLVVGAGPSGQQIAAELRRTGRAVILAVGRHARMIRRYRGRDIFAWLNDLGDLDETLDEVHDPIAAKHTPSFALIGANGGEQLDLAVLHGLGVTVTGRFERLQAHSLSSPPICRKRSPMPNAGCAACSTGSTTISSTPTGGAGRTTPTASPPSSSRQAPRRSISHRPASRDLGHRLSGRVSVAARTRPRRQRRARSMLPPLALVPRPRHRGTAPASHRPTLAGDKLST